MAVTPASWFTFWFPSKNTFSHPPHPSILRIGRYCASVRFARKDPFDTTRHSYRLSNHWTSVGKQSTTSLQLESTMQTQASLQKISFSYFSRIGAYYQTASSPFIWPFYYLWIKLMQLYQFQTSSRPSVQAGKGGLSWSSKYIFIIDKGQILF